MTITPLHFDVSTGLKSVLGSDLITQDEVAIFELVKNSFDAEASRVDLYFDHQQIIVADNGVGMSYEDIKGKWLFVAYSAKRSSNQQVDFRDVVAERKHYAGSKGIGRFSSDRLGRSVELQTRSKKDTSTTVHNVSVDWSKFDHDHKDHFEDISINYQPQLEGFKLPKGVPGIQHGTVISIGELRTQWDREKLLRLKSSLAKLINPFGVETDGFQIFINAPHEVAGDEADQKQSLKSGEDIRQNSTVNGAVGNFIFSTLQEKTTFIEVSISADGDYIESTLVDRGELIYKIREPNDFDLLSKSGFRCQIFFLNHSAKATFTRRMGVPSVQFGSVFLFRNGFRVFPIGEVGDDWFGLDHRKAQGYARFLGTRDLIGRIDVYGTDVDFQEASSRDAGLIENETVEQLRKCFRESCLIRLERYVVPVTFVDVEDKYSSDVTRLLTDPARARVTAALARLVDDKNVELIEYSKRLVGILSERSAQFESSLASLRAIAEKTKDGALFENIEQAERRFEELRNSEARAQKQADEERKAKEAAQARAVVAEKLVSHVSEKLDEEKKRNLFLSSIASLDTDTILNLHHQVTNYAVVIQQQIENFLVKISNKDNVPVNDVISAMESIALLNRKIMGVSKFATKANFRLESEQIDADIGEYIQQYIDGVAKDFISSSMSISVASDGKGFVQKIKPIDISVIIDNLVANARKAKATRVSFAISHPNKNAVHIRIVDNGRGFHSQIDDINRIFEKGFTTTDGSGLGLYHVRQVLGEMSGTIEVLKTDDDVGAAFLIRIAK